MLTQKKGHIKGLNINLNNNLTRTTMLVIFIVSIILFTRYFVNVGPSELLGSIGAGNGDGPVGKFQGMIALEKPADRELDEAKAQEKELVKKEFSHGTTYDGEWKDSAPHGTGLLQTAGGEKKFGEFRRGALSGKGVILFSETNVFLGKFKEGNLAGSGLLYSGNEHFAVHYDDGNVREIKRINRVSGNFLPKFFGEEWTLYFRTYLEWSEMIEKTGDTLEPEEAPEELDELKYL